MFGRGFVNQILVPASMGSPAGVTGPALAFTRLVLHAPAAWNAGFAITQLLLGAGLLWRPTVRAALASSVAWALGVWWFGEGLGGVLSGIARPLTGAPGRHPVRGAGRAGLARARTVLASTPQASTRRRGPRGMTGTLGRSAGAALGLTGARVVWLVLWGSFAYFILQAANRAPDAARDTFASSRPGNRAGSPPPWTGASPAPRAVTVSRSASAWRWFSLRRVWGCSGGPARGPALVLSVIVALAIWVLGENSGELATGQGTDPNTGLLLVALAAAFWPLARRPAAPVSGWS